MPTPADIRVLAIDDDPLFLEIVQQHLARDGYQVETAIDPRVGLRRVIEQDYDLILLDLMMPGLHGEEVLELLKPLNRQHRVLVVSAHDEADFRSRTRDLGAAGYLQKPVTPAALRRAVVELTSGHPRAEVSQGPRDIDLLSVVAGWVYETPADTPLRRWSAVAVILFQASIVAWLLLS